MTQFINQKWFRNFGILTLVNSFPLQLKIHSVHTHILACLVKPKNDSKNEEFHVTLFSYSAPLVAYLYNIVVISRILG